MPRMPTTVFRVPVMCQSICFSIRTISLFSLNWLWVFLWSCLSKNELKYRFKNYYTVSMRHQICSTVNLQLSNNAFLHSHLHCSVCLQVSYWTGWKISRIIDCCNALENISVNFKPKQKYDYVLISHFGFG